MPELKCKPVDNNDLHITNQSMIQLQNK